MISDLPCYGHPEFSVHFRLCEFQDGRGQPEVAVADYGAPTPASPRNRRVGDCLTAHPFLVDL